jgi:S-adenosylmethionine hydrolase
MEFPLLVFTTDFGLADSYVGVMKGVAIGINPQARFIDLTHGIGPQDIGQGAFVLGVNYRHFPQTAIHVVVVDPDVGTSRWPILISTPHGRFVGPDNGVLSRVLSDYLEDPPDTGEKVELPPGVSAVRLTNKTYWNHPVSDTFHGRDVFAPVAAHLSLGVPPTELGEPIPSLVWLPNLKPVIDADGVSGQVIYKDGFGNLVTNIPVDLLSGDTGIQVSIGGQTINGLSRTFADTGPSSSSGLIALPGSHGYLEVAVPRGNAAAVLGADAGNPVTVTFADG